MSQKNIEVFKRDASNERTEDYVVKKVIICGDTVIVKSAKRKRSNTNRNRNTSNQTKKPRNIDKSKNRVANERTLLNSLKNASLIILNNFCGDDNEMFITLTYAEPQQDVCQMQNDFKAFWRKIKRAYPGCAYIRIAEPNDVGAWHFHVLVKDFANEKLVIDMEKLIKFWGNGRVHTEKIYSIHGLANYFIPSKSNKAKEKARMKYSRLRFYPKGFNAYSCSKDMIPPKEIEMTDEQLAILVPNLDLHYAHLKDVVMTDEDGKKRLLNSYLYQEYRIRDNSINQIFQPELSGERKEVDE